MKQKNVICIRLRSTRMKKNMKKTIGVAAAILMSAALTACQANHKETDPATEQSTEQTTESTSAVQTPVERVNMKDLDVESMVTVGDYHSIRVAKMEVQVPEDQVQESLDMFYVDSFPAEMGVKDRAVEVGDTANIDYEGKKDGVAFDRGTAQGTNLTIGSHSFIDGFEDGLVGVTPGETVDLNLTFPEAYPDADLAGQSVVFTVTVNYIIPAEKIDDAVPSFGIPDVSTVEELRQYIYDYYKMQMEYDNEDMYEQEVMTALLDICEFKDIPENLISSYKDMIRYNIEQRAASQGMDGNSFISAAYGMDMDSYLDAYATDSIHTSLAVQWLANKENLQMDDEELNSTLEMYAMNYGYSSVDEFVGDSSLEEFREYFTYEKVYEFLKEIAGQE